MDKQHVSRRSFLQNTAKAAMLITTADLSGLVKKSDEQEIQITGEQDNYRTNGPWYRNVTRWGQVNITEKDPPQYDISWWRSYWKRTDTKGIVVNAGGIVAYYPTQIPLHKKAVYLKEGDDLFGNICRAAHEDGVAVFARMDSNRADETFYQAHPGWFTVDGTGNPYKADDLYISCINSPYYTEHIPAILREIATLYHPEGFTDNSWSGLGRESICYCENCKKDFHDKTGKAIPVVKNWDDAVYRQWIHWNYARRLEIWDLNNRVCKAAGGEDCIWSGMNSGSISGQSKSFRNLREICKRAEIIMLDDQSRSDNTGFQHNGENGKLIHGLLGWDKLIPESMAMYQAHDPWFRLASKPEPEARMWMLEGIAGGIQPWWHMISAYHEDRRMYHNPEKVFHWHKENERYLVNRFPVATVGVVWSQENMDFYGRDHTDELVESPWRGMVQALIRARIPYLPVHIDDLDRDASKFSVLVMPNLAAMSDEQAAGIRKFVKDGGSLVATGDSSLFDQWGDKRTDYALADLFGAHYIAPGNDDEQPPSKRLAGDAYHTYLRLAPDLRAQTDGPHKGPEPAIVGKRHPILKGFEETDTIPFGGLLRPLRIDADVEMVASYIPQFPVYPPEKAYMRVPKTDIPGILLNEKTGQGRVVFIPADLDKQFGRTNLPDHGNLLKNIIRWAAKENIPVNVEGAGLVDCHLYTQQNRMILHLVNLTSAAAWRQPLDELISIGPLKVSVQLSKGIAGNKIRPLVANKNITAKVSGGRCHFEVASILDHEVIVIG
ncbi:MAG: beta-galactosidase [Chitinophagaceae bacterium]